MRLVFLIALIFASSASIAWSHPGHQTIPVGDESPAHYVFEPQHGIIYAIAIILSAVVCAAIMMRRGKDLS